MGDKVQQNFDNINIARLNAQCDGHTNISADGNKMIFTTDSGICVDVSKATDTWSACRMVEQVEQQYRLTNPLAFNNNSSKEKPEYLKKYEAKMSELEQQLKDYGILKENAVKAEKKCQTEISFLYAKNGQDLSVWSVADKSALSENKTGLSDARWDQVSANNGEFSTGIEKFLAACNLAKESAFDYYGRMIQNLQQRSV